MRLKIKFEDDQCVVIRNAKEYEVLPEFSVNDMVRFKKTLDFSDLDTTTEYYDTDIRKGTFAKVSSISGGWKEMTVKVRLNDYTEWWVNPEWIEKV